MLGSIFTTGGVQIIRLDLHMGFSSVFLLLIWFHPLTDLISRPNKARIRVDGQAAFEHVTQLVSFGPRPPGSLGISQAQSYIKSALKKIKLEVEEQDFLASTPNGPISMKNIIAKTPVDQGQVIILASHYDTLLMKSMPFVGANDGGSSTGLLLELARVHSTLPREFTFWFVFFDGEEAQAQWSETDSLYGSRYFVEKLKMEGKASKIKAMILMDMIGDKDLRLERDLSSTPWLLELTQRSALELGYSKHLGTMSNAIQDDHVPFIKAGIPAVDLIDYDYGFNNVFWHTSNDTLDKISPQSLKIVGDIVVRVVEKLGVNR